MKNFLFVVGSGILLLFPCSTERGYKIVPSNSPITLSLRISLMELSATFTVKTHYGRIFAELFEEGKTDLTITFSIPSSNPSYL